MKNNLKLKAWILLYVFLYQIFSPAVVQALTSGPAQPEMASFEPYGTTELVDPFTGDFTYNIPLMDIEGYPINIAYNSGVTMEQEASWVGLGWNLNVGTVNRSVRGLPDDFKGDAIVSERNIKKMEITSAGLGASLEVFGSENQSIASASSSYSLIYNNYKGWGISRSISAGPTLDLGGMEFKPSIGMTVNSLEGTSFDASLGMSLMNKEKTNYVGGSIGSGYNTRSGKVQLSLGTSAGYKDSRVSNSKNHKGESGTVGHGVSGSYSWMPVGLESFTPYPTFPMSSNAVSFSGSIGGEFSGFNASGKLFGSRTVQELKDKTKSNNSYGYIYSEKGGKDDLQDFNKPKPVQLNKTIQYLSPINYTYDVFSVSGQGVGGMFRPFRNDVGLLGNPDISYKNSSSSDLGAEVGIGSIFKAGVDVSLSRTDVEYGKWYFSGSDRYRFHEEKRDSPYENVYFKAAGELTQSDLDNFYANGGYEPLEFKVSGNNTNGKLITAGGSTINHLYSKNSDQRGVRSKLFFFKTASEAKYYGLEKNINDYEGKYYQDSLSIDTLSRETNDREPHHISEIVQTNPNGERYVYGIPAYNLSKKEVSFAVDNESADSSGLVNYSQTGDASHSNDNGLDHFYSSTSTPPYAHSFLLTAKLSPDYRDVTGNGISDDDLGNAYKFNYSRKSTGYKWRVPYSKASFQEGFSTDNLDQKASYTYGEKELWYVHSIESKNQIAEFYISPRKDGIGVKGESGGIDGSPQNNRLFKLDSIILYQKYDRLKNKENAFPIKRVVFNYDYSLCEGVENNVQDGDILGDGKLTLLSIEISHGKNRRGALSPYVFTYSSVNPDYDSRAMDRWGNYKPSSENPGGIKNKYFPYSHQNNRDSVDAWASAWFLEEIITPSGGTINIEYEADDYAYVQDKKAMQMYAVLGAGQDEIYSSDTTLYNNDYLYVKRPPEIDPYLEDEAVKRLLFGGKNRLNNMYFKFKTNIKGNKHEYVSGYADAIDAGICPPPDTDYMYIEIENSSPNVISKAAWDYFRHNLMNVLYGYPNINDNGVESIIKGLAANVGDIKKMFTGVEDYLRNRDVANKFRPDYSFIRLNNMTGFKVGGGTRVESIHLNDHWNDMVGEGGNAIYGQEYEYTTKDKNGFTISSGVASYEPMIGNDENPFRKPVPYVAAGKSGHIPAIDAYQETPIGENFFPSASVGYSKVTIKDLHRDIGRSAKSITEHQFYTAKDFPVIVKATGLNPKYYPPSGGGLSYPLSNQVKKSEFIASQGYSILLNDMHGKSRSVVTYFYETDQNGKVTKKPLSGTEYFYHTKNSSNGLMLDNEVEVINKSGKIEEKLLGVEYDIATGSSYSYQKTKFSAYKLGLDLFLPGGFLPLPFAIPNMWANFISNIQESKTVVTTKVVQSYGILESVRNFTDQHSLTVSNQLYDGQSGQVLLTKTTDEYFNEEYQLKMPAYLSDKSRRMGPAYQNINFMGSIIPSDDDCNKNNDIYKNPGHLLHGDKVAVYPYGDISEEPLIAWVDIAINSDTAKELATCPPEPRFITYTTNESGRGCLCHYYVGRALNGSQGKHSRPTIDSNIIAFHLKPNNSDKVKSLFEEFKLDNPTSPIIDFYEDQEPCEDFFKHHVNLYQKVALTHPIVDLFDLNDTLKGTIDSAFVPSPTNPRSEVTLNIIPGEHERFLTTGQVILVQQKKNGNPENYLHILSEVEPPGDTIYPGCSSGNYALLDRYGNRISTSTIDSTAFLKVIKSGYQNTQALHAGTISSLTNPILKDGEGFFEGIKTTGLGGFKLLQANYAEYSDSYELQEVYSNSLKNSSPFNKFLSGSDSKFIIKNAFRYIAQRAQSPTVNTASDGYILNSPALWSIDSSECSFMISPPSVGSVNSGWFLTEGMDTYYSNGTPIESHNVLDISSTAQIEKNGYLRAVAKNARSSQVLVENFEYYYHILSSDRAYDTEYGLLKKDTANNPLLNINNREHSVLEAKPALDDLLVKGIAHTGEYSIFLKGDGPGTDSTEISFEQNPLYPIEAFELRDTNENPFQQTMKVHYTDVDTENKNKLAEQILPQYYSSIPFSNASTIFESSIHDSLLPAGEYYITGWVKDMAHSGLAFKGASPEIEILIGSPYTGITCNKSSKVINGWQKFEKTFTVPSGNPNISIRFEGGLWGAFFDDIRIHPVNSQVATYVYDAITGRVVAKLDENNYATFYGYNDEGIPSQVKKETAAGVLTISESRQSTNKHPFN